MSDETALLRAIAAHPDEDTPRLAYADWLDEHSPPAPKGRGKKGREPTEAGNPRAAFIRGQVELARSKEDSMQRRELAFRCRQLLDEHEKDWIVPDELAVYDYGWSRGFVESFTTTPSDLDLQDAELFDTHPFRRVWLWKLKGKIAAAELIPAENRITALDLTGNGLNLAQLKKLAKMSHFEDLRELGLMFNDLRDTAVKVLCGEPFFRRLELIRLGANPITDRGRDRLRAHFGDRVTFAHDREPERLYTLQDDRLRVGWGRDFTQFYLRAREHELRVALFDHAGNLLRIEERPVEQPAKADYKAREANREAARDRWLEELGYESATIKVKRFQFPDGVGITPFNWWADVFDGEEGGLGGHPHMRGSVERWLEEGQYRFNFGGDDAWFDRTGEVTDT
jgi:uncharacterized protein (TIGR02996 family)